MRVSNCLLLATVAALAPATAANASTAPRYHVQMHVTDGTQMIRDGFLTVNAGSIANLSSGDDHYIIAVTAVPSWVSPTNRIALSTNILIEGGPADASQYRRLARTVDVIPNKPIEIVVPGDPATKAKPFTVQFTVTPASDPG